MKVPKSLSHFSKVEISVMAIVVAFLVGISFMIVSQQREYTQAPSPPAPTETVPKIADDEDLIKAEKMLDEVPVEDSKDSSQLDEELSAF